MRNSCSLLLLALLISGCGNGVNEKASVVDMAAVERRDIIVSAEATGVVEPIQIVEIKSKASGEVIKVAVETGEVVEKGDLLVQVDTRDLKNAVDQALADLDVAKTSLTVATSQRERSDRLLKSGLISDEQHEGALLSHSQAKAQLIKAETSLELARERLADATVRAPSPGTILQKNVEEGTIISSATSQVSGGTLILTMADLSTVQVRTLVDETDIGRIESGLRATITVEAYRDRDFTGAVLKVEPLAVVEQSVTMFPVLTQIPNEEGLLKPGMNADVEVHIDRKLDVVAVPLEAVRSVREMAILAPLVGLTSDDVTAVMESMRGGGPGDAGPGGDGAHGGPGRGGMGTGEANEDSAAGAGMGQSAAREGSHAGAPGGESAGRPVGSGRGGSGSGAMGGGRPSGATRGGPGGGMMRGAHGAPGSSGFGDRGAGGMSVGIAFVKVNGAFQPRVVRTGVSDWDFKEVLEGLETGETVALLPSAQLYMENEQMMERFRSRSSVVGSSRNR